MNYGTSALSEISYSWSEGTYSGNGTYTLETPLQPSERVTVPVTVGPCGECGRSRLDVTVDTFNGEPNGDPRKSASGAFYVMPFMPVNRPLVEEFTGLRCGYCPRGYVAMEEMRRMS